MPGKKTQPEPPQPTWEKRPGNVPFVVTLLAAFVAQVGRMVESVQPWYPLLVGLAGAFAVSVARHRRKISAGVAWFQGAIWVGTSVWTGWVMWQGWSPIAVATIFAIGVLAWLMAPAVADDPQSAAAQQLVAEQQQQAVTDPFEHQLVTVIHSNVQLAKDERLNIRKVYDWPNNTGHTWYVEGQLGSSFNWERLRDCQVGMAAGLRLPTGCPMNAMQAPTHQGAALLHIATVNDMDKEIVYPSGYGTIRTIRDPFCIGLYGDKTEVLVDIYQTSGLIAGQRGGGKTVLLQGMTASTLQTNDALVWHVDLNGGGMSSAWMIPFAKGMMPLPILDRIAPTPRTALALAEHGEAIAKHRKRRYQAMMIAHDADVIPVGNGRDLCSVCDDIHPPAIMIFVDEGGEVTGEDAGRDARAAGEALRSLQRIGRAMAVNVIFSVQRGTSDYVPAQMKKNTGLTISLRVKDDAELAYLFDWKRGLSASDLKFQGQAYVQRGNESVRMAKIFRLMPKQITEIAQVTLARRPQLDEDAVALGGADYAGRWDHPDIAEFLDGLRGGRPGGGTATLTAPPRRETPPPVPGARLAQQGLNTLDEVIKMGEAAVAARTTAPPPSPADDRTARIDQVIEGMSPAELAARLDALAFTPDDSPPATPMPSTPAPQAGKAEPSKADRYKFVVAMVRERGPIKTGDIIDATIAARYTTRRQTVNETISDAAAAGDIVSTGYATWIAPRG